MSGAAKDPFLRPAIRQRPLMMHLGLASAALAGPHLTKGQSFGNDFWQDEEGRRTIASMEKVVEGLRRYQMHPYERKLMHKSVVWSDGQARLVWFAAKTTKKQKSPKAQILVIPSMINGPEILDIVPEEQSLLRWLATEGYDVFLLEWGNMREDEELADIESALSVKVPKLLDWFAKEKSDLPLYGLGYCMGGVLLTAAEILHPDIFDGLIFIATPWDFEAGGKESFAEAIRKWVGEGGLLRVAHIDYMPNEWLQLIFAGTDPAMVARKFSSFADMDRNGPKARLFVAVEDWVNGGHDLPAGIIRQAVQDWYIKNKPVHGKWRVGGQTINAAKIKKPSFVVVPAKDRIVPPVSARPLGKQIKGATILTPDCGHISMMVSAKAQEEVWEPLKRWILSQNSL